MEGIKGWQQCIHEVKSDTGISFTADHLDLVGNVPDSPSAKFKSMYCNSEFECHTNISYFMELNQHSIMTQPSTSDQSIVDAERISLNVPQPYSRKVRLTFSTNVGTHKPILILSTVAYAHDIHTLFYYA